jgi:hypothetical protein
MIFLKKIYELSKPFLVPAIVILLAFFIIGKVISSLNIDREDFSAKLKEMQSIHEAELKKILDAKAEEARRHEENLVNLQRSLDVAVAKHEEKLKELEKNKEEAIKKILAKYKDDPAGLSRELGRVTKLPVLIPNENQNE